MNEAIRVSRLSKSYRIGSRRDGYRTLRDAISRSLSFRRADQQAGDSGRIWALKDVSFEVGSGEAVGIIGRNGAGKSTMLKILSRITEPTTGKAWIQGRVGSLLEVGTGFHPELTGIENVYLNGAILGMKRAEIARKFDQIISFAGVEKFVDTPVKHYSSGMYLRLAFAVAAHLEPQILLIDEVLAVGDLEFQRRCLGKMGEVARQGRTVLFVSHNMSAVRALCSRSIWLEGGEVAADGDSDSVVASYIARMSDTERFWSNPDSGFNLNRVALKNGHGVETSTFRPGDDLIVEAHYEALTEITRPHFIVIVQSDLGPCFAANMLIDGQAPASIHGSGVVSCRFRQIPLLPRSYSITMAIRSSDGSAKIMSDQEVASFSVAADLQALGLSGDLAYRVIEKSVPVMIPYEWTMPDGDVAAGAMEEQVLCP